MTITLGIDIGGSTTKIVGFENNIMVDGLQVKADDPITSVFGGIGNFLSQNEIKLNEIEKITLTGVGATYIHNKIYDIDTYKVEEINAIGHGGLYLAEIKQAFVVSLGTGTAFVRATQKNVEHIGGSGIGGGTLIGLVNKIIGQSDIEAVLDMAGKGKIENVDLFVHEIMKYQTPSLPMNLTASNFGKLKCNTTNADFTIGIVNMIFQTIGMLSVFACRNDPIKDFILIGTLTEFPQAQNILSAISDIYGINFIVPDNAVFATAIGSVVSHIKESQK